MLGNIFIVLGVVLLFPLGLSIYFNEGLLLYKAFLIPASIALFSGILMNNINPKHLNMNLTTSMIVCGIGWLSASIIGAIPFWIALRKRFLDTLFESVSGFTTTGITVFQNLNQMPASIIFWRSLIQWLGGLGILTFFLLITFRSEGEIWQLFTAESHKFETSRPVPNIFKSIQILW